MSILIDILNIFLGRISQILIDFKSTMVRVITWANVDPGPWHLMASPGLSESTYPDHLYITLNPKISNIRCIKSQNFNDSRHILQLSLPNLLKPGVKLRMKMELEQRR